MIEPMGNHPNRAGGVVQVVDAASVKSIVNRFNADADAGKLSHGHEMLIDHEHFKHQADQETIAYGWLTKLTNRDDGIYGQIRWTGTGQAAVDKGDYRFFSTEYDPADLKVLNDGKPKQVRPLRLDGLTLTNDPNNKGGKPITNRVLRTATMDDGKCTCPDCEGDLAAVADQPGTLHCPACQTNFASVSAPAATETKPLKKMKNIATKLGLVADANEDSIVAAIDKLHNRITTLEPLEAENKKLTNRLATHDDEQIQTLLADHGVKDAKLINRLTPQLTPLTNRQERVDLLTDFGFKPAAAGAAVRVLNRGQGNPPETTATGSADDEKAKADKIRNRAGELKKGGMNYDAAFRQAAEEVNAGK